MSAPEVGAPYRWIPAAFTVYGEDSSGVLGATVYVNGRISYVNEQHLFFRAEAVFPGGIIRECFKW